MIAIVLKPGETTLADWRAIYRGAVPKLDPACYAAVERSALAVARIVAAGKPVYGINTGFGKLASVRIDTADLAASSGTSCCRMPRGLASRCRRASPV